MIDEMYQDWLENFTREDIFALIPYVIDVLFGMVGVLVFVSFLDSVFAFLKSGGDGHAMESSLKGIRSNVFTFFALYLFWILLRLGYEYTMYMVEELVM